MLTIKFIQYVEEVTWLSLVIIVPKKNGKLKIYIDFRKLNATAKKDPHLLPFTDEVLNTVAMCETYFFLDGYLGYHEISIAPKDRYKIAFVQTRGLLYGR